jgi:hypothetical protein
MVGFEQLCANQALTLFVLPPKRPQLNGAVDARSQPGDTSSTPATIYLPG